MDSVYKEMFYDLWASGEFDCESDDYAYMLGYCVEALNSVANMRMSIRGLQGLSDTYREALTNAINILDDIGGNIGESAFGEGYGGEKFVIYTRLPMLVDRLVDKLEAISDLSDRYKAVGYNSLDDPCLEDTSPDESDGEQCKQCHDDLENPLKDSICPKCSTPKVEKIYTLEGEDLYNYIHGDEPEHIDAEDTPICTCTNQLNRVREHMLEAYPEWLTLEEIGEETGIRSWSSIASRLRDLRMPRHGGYIVERRLHQKGIFEYRVH